MKLLLLSILIVISCFNQTFAQEWQRIDLSFNFDTHQNSLKKNIMIDRSIKISPFAEVTNLGVKQISSFRLIMGQGSLSLFDALGVDEVAGLSRIEALHFINNLTKQGKTEKNGAFIAGLTNINADGQFFIFFNLERMGHSKEMAKRILAHESLHMARILITKIENPTVDMINDSWSILNDSNDELFSEMLERIFTISSHYFFSNFHFK